MTAATNHIARVIADSGEVYPMEPVFQERLHFAIPPSTDVKTLQRELALAYEGFAREREVTKDLSEAVRRLLHCMKLAGWEGDDSAIFARAALSRASQ